MSAALTPTVDLPCADEARSAHSPCAAFESVAEFTFKSHQAGIEQFPPRDDDNVNPYLRLVQAEDLSNKTLGAVPDHRSTQLAGGRDTQTPEVESIWEAEQRERPAVHLDATVVDLLVLGPATNALASIDTRHGGKTDAAAHRRTGAALGWASTRC